MQIKILDKRLTPEMLKPATPGSAAIDLRACIDKNLTIYPGETALIPAGFAMHMNTVNMAAQILPRSGLGSSQGLILGNGTGLIDSDYQGQVYICAWNRTGVKWEELQDSCRFVDNAPACGNQIIIEPMQSIAQMIFVPVLHPEQEFVEEFDSETLRGSGGFGSTDKNNWCRMITKDIT